MVTYLNRFSTNLADLTSVLRELTKKHVHFSLELYHQQALNRIKKELCTPELISYYDPEPKTPTTLQCEARKTGIGAWLLQLNSQANEHIVAMASRSLKETESRCSNLECECLALTHGLGKFGYFLLGGTWLLKLTIPLWNKFLRRTSMRLLAGCKGYSLDAYDLMSMCSTSKEDPFQSPMPCREFVTG